jgi:hypothetical protein
MGRCSDNSRITAAKGIQMRTISVIRTGVLFLLFGAIAPMHAQQSQEPKPKQAPHEKGQQKQDARPTPPGLQSREPEQAQRKIEDKDKQEAWGRYRAHAWQSEHRGWKQRGGYDGYRIPPERFRSAFGRDHWFRIHSAPMLMVGGYPRFQYGGYWFRLVDPWPEGWSNNWYQSDDAYIDFTDDGYYLYNRRYPNTPIAVRVYVE